MLDLAIVIVNFNTRKFLRNCLTSIYNSRGDFTFEVCVVDNASSDGSADMVRADFPQVFRGSSPTRRSNRHLKNCRAFRALHSSSTRIPCCPRMGWR